MAKAKAVTRADLGEDLDRFEQKLDKKLDKMFDEKLEPYVTKVDLQRELSRFVTIERFDSTMRVVLNAIEGMRLELGQHVLAIMEQLGAQVGAVDDKYRDLPDRVAKLEDVTRR
jgi:DNA integrity scanning protein DisA with diadenylate cyclase activity